MALDIQSVRKNFPILQRTVDGQPLVYLDNGASAQKPMQMLEAIQNLYSNNYSNIHRSAHTLSRESTALYESARTTCEKFFNVKKDSAVVFTSGTTQSINIIAYSYGEKFLKSTDTILVSALEHHANLTPWQLCAEKTKCSLKIIPISESGDIDFVSFEKLLKENSVKLVSICEASNVLGTVNDVARISALCKNYGALLSLDSAQSSPHFLSDFENTNCDFMSLSAHKCYGPTGLGLLIAKRNILNSMQPYQCGGDMVDTVTFEKSTYKEAPEFFEAGTQNIEGAIAFAQSLDYLSSLDKKEIATHENSLRDFALEELSQIKEVRLLGNAKNRLPIFSFVADKIHPYDISSLLDANGIAIRAGNHCAQPLGRLLNAPISCRASFAFYNTLDEAKFFIEKLKYAINLLS